MTEDIPLKAALQPIRLKTLLHLEASGGEAEFGATREAIGLTERQRQSLTSHTATLEAAGLIEKRRRFVGHVPKTKLVITSAGRTALAHLRGTMEVAE
jgi:DNA-binding MarR family transcriptional regulator